MVLEFTLSTIMLKPLLQHHQNPDKNTIITRMFLMSLVNCMEKAGFNNTPFGEGKRTIVG